jgi:hypothetical protein
MVGFRADGLNVLALDSASNRIDLTAAVGDVLHEGEVLTIVNATTPGEAPAPPVLTEPPPTKTLGPRGADVAGLAVLACLSVVAAGTWNLASTWSGPWSGHTLYLTLSALAISSTCLVLDFAGPERWRPAMGPVAVSTVVLAVGWTLAALLGWPATVMSAIAGFAPLALRLASSAAVTAPMEQLVNIAAYATGKWTVRGPVPGTAGEIRPEATDHLTQISRIRLRSAAICISLIAVIFTPALLEGPPQTPLYRWLTIASGVMVALGLALAPRVTSDRLVRMAARYGAGLVAIEVAFTLGHNQSLTTSAALAASGLAIILFLASILAGRGYRSIGLSRIGDWIETLTVVFAPACALIGAGWIDLLRAAGS